MVGEEPSTGAGGGASREIESCKSGGGHLQDLRGIRCLQNNEEKEFRESEVSVDDTDITSDFPVERVALVIACAIPTRSPEEERDWVDRSQGPAGERGEGAATRAVPKGMGDIFRRHCEQGNVAQIQEMLTTFGDSPVVNEVDEFGKSPIFLCAAYGKAEALQVLLAAGLDATYANDGGFSPLTIAMLNQHEDCVALLKHHGAKVLPGWLSLIPCAELILGHYFVGCFLCSCPFVLHIIGHLFCRHVCHRNPNRANSVTYSTVVTVTGVVTSIPPGLHPSLSGYDGWRYNL